MTELPHLCSAWDVDRHIVLDSADKVVAIRFSSYEHPPTEALQPYLNAPLESSTNNNNKNKVVLEEDEETQQQQHYKRVKFEHTSSANSLANESIKLNKPKNTISNDLINDNVNNKYKTDQSVNTSTSINDVLGLEHYVSTQHMDAMLLAIAPKVRKYCVIYAVDTNTVTEFNEMYELGHERDPFALMFFFRNQHIKVDVGTGNNNKINFFAFNDNSEVIEIINAVFRAGKLGKNMTSTDRTYSTVSVKR